MRLTIKVESRLGELPDVRWKCLLEREIDVDDSVNLSQFVSNLHVLFGSVNHRILVMSYEV